MLHISNIHCALVIQASIPFSVCRFSYQSVKICIIYVRIVGIGRNVKEREREVRTCKGEEYRRREKKFARWWEGDGKGGVELRAKNLRTG